MHMYMYTRSGGGTRGSGVRMQRAVRRAQPLWWPEGLISIEGLGPLTFISPRRHSPEAEGSLGGSTSAAAAACSWRRAGAGQRLEVRGALCVAGGREVGRRGALCEPICRLRGRGFVCWRRPRAGRPGLSGRGMRRASRRTHHSLYRSENFFLAWLPRAAAVISRRTATAVSWMLTSIACQLRLTMVSVNKLPLT